MNKLEYSKEDLIEMQNDIDKLQHENQKYKEVIDKAIKYLEDPNRDSFDYSKATLLDILKEVEE